jgi:hypothetical protein
VQHSYCAAQSAAAVAEFAPLVRDPGRGKKGGRQCFHGGLQSREETPKEGMCGRSCRTATISVAEAALARVFFLRYANGCGRRFRRSRDFARNLSPKLRFYSLKQ